MSKSTKKEIAQNIINKTNSLIQTNPFVVDKHIFSINITYIMLVKMTKSSPTKLVLLYSLKKNNLTDANKFYQ